MATTNYSWNLPTVGGSEGTWGTLLNSNWTSLDTLLGGTNATEFAILDGATVTTTEVNYLSGVTSAVQTQIDAKADDTDASIATSISLTGAASDWKFSLSGNNLIISYGATNLAKLDTSGNLTVIGDVTAFGTI
jgi:hypothetical protein